MGCVGSKTSLPGQIIGNSCLHSRGHICDPILMKLCQNVSFDNIQAKFEYGLCRVKNQVTRSNHRKFLFTIQRPHLRSNFDETLSECLFRHYLGQVRTWVMSGQKLVYVSTHCVKTVKQLVKNRYSQLTRWCCGNASALGARGPGFNSQLRQRFLCLIFCFVVVVFLLFAQKHIICHKSLQFLLQFKFIQHT